MVRLFRIFKNNKDKSVIPKFNFRHINNLLFPGKTYNDTGIRKHLSNFNKLIENYFRFQNFENYKKYNDLFLYRELNKRSPNNLYGKKLSDYINSFKDNEKSYPGYFNTKFLTQYEQYRFYLSLFDIDGLHIVSDDLQNTLYQNLIFSSASIYILYEIHRLFCKKKITLLPVTKYFLVNKKNEDFYRKYFPGDYCVYLFALILYSKSYSRIKELLDFLENNSGRIFYGVIDFILNYLLVFIIFKYDTGNSFSGIKMEKFLELYLKFGTLERKRPLSLFFFRLCSDFLLEDNSLSDIENLMTSEISCISKVIRNDILNISIARIYYSLKKYHISEEQLKKVNSRNYLIYIQSNVLLIMIYFDTNRFDSFFKTLFKFTLFVQRNKKIPDELRISLDKFNYFINELGKAVKSSSGTGNIKLKIHSVPDFFNKQWLLNRS